MVCRTRFAHPTPRIPFTVLAAVSLVSGLPLSAQASISVVGGLANFDVVNNTGRPAYGFEIEFEDHNFYKGDVGSVFGLNRDFGPARGGALGVVRFGTVDVSDYDDGAGHHLGVRITYGGQFASGITTPFNAGSFNTPGESCWPPTRNGKTTLATTTACNRRKTRPPRVIPGWWPTLRSRRPPALRPTPRCWRAFRR